MTEKSSDFPYLHGFSCEEQQRLRRQAAFAEQTVFQEIDFSKVKSLLEVGCGVGAQSEILLRRFPRLKLTGIDRSASQLESARQALGASPACQGRYELLEMDATHLDFDSEAFDGAFLCWVLEHMPDPARCLSEVRRVLHVGAPIVITEVMNSSFFLDPYSPNVWKYWMAFNDFQIDTGGDPFIGAKLGNLLAGQGFRDIRTRVKTWHLDNRNPGLRKEIIDFWTDLLLSAAGQLIAQNYVDEQLVTKMKAELKRVANDPNAVFYYSFIQAFARVY